MLQISDYIILEAPCRVYNIKVNGEDTQVMEPMGFWNFVDAVGERNLISNPLKEWKLYSSDTANHRIFIRLVPAQFENAGTNDEQASLNNDLTSV
jgi:hypothetical protein